MLKRARARCNRLLRDERGIALPTAMLITVIGLGLATVPIMASVNTQSGDRRDQASDAALAAADSGIDIAITRQTQMASTLSTSKPCVKKTVVESTRYKLEAVAPQGAWCPQVGPETVGNSTYVYRVKPAYTSSSAAISVLATGSSTTGGKTVTRRLLVNATASGSGNTPVVFGAEGVVGIDSVTMTNGTIYGDVGSNGNIQWPNGDAHIVDCSKVRVGSPSGAFTKQSWQTYPACPIVKETRKYPNVVVPLTNSNSRMFTAGGDTYTYSNGALAGCGAANWQASWCPTTKVLYLTSDATVTLGGTAPYVLCQLRMDNDAKLIMAAGARIQIIFDSPENCGQSSGVEQFSLRNGAAIRSASFSPSTGNYAVPGLYFVGSDSRTTEIYMDGGTAGNNMIIYAPRTAIEIRAGASFGGAILGKSIYMDGGTRVKPEGTGGFAPDENLPVAGSGTPTTFSQGSFVECSAAPTSESEPASGC